jgi:glutaredoxin
MENTNKLLPPTFDTCPYCKQVVRVDAEQRLAKHGTSYRPCMGSKTTAPAAIISVEAVEIISVTEVA